MSQITVAQLERAACVYVRQSTMGQVQNNLESQRRQYALAERAKDLGFNDVLVIDDDLGRSGVLAAVEIRKNLAGDFGGAGRLKG